MSGNSFFGKPVSPSSTVKETVLPEGASVSTFVPNTPSKGSFFSKSVDKTEKKPGSLFSSPVIRKRVNVTTLELKKYSDNDELAQKALGIILMTNVDGLNAEKILAFGREVQESHQFILSDLLKETQSADVSAVKSYILDLLKMLEGEPMGYFKRLFISDVEKNRDKEIANLSDEIGTYLPFLRTMKTRLAEMEKNIQNLSKELEVCLIVTSFFAEYQGLDVLTQGYISRTTSLQATKVNLIQNNAQRKIYSDLVQNLIELIQTVILTDLPNWCTNQISKNLGKASKQDTDKQKQTIISKIKSTIV